MDIILPDWAPNIHPLLVHFPIALLMTAIGMNLLMLIFSKTEGFKYTTAVLYILGAAGTVAAYFSGREAVETVEIPPAANSILGDHADMALLTLLFFLVVAVIYIVLWWKAFKVDNWVLYLVFVLGAGGSVLLMKTGEYGGRMVFEQGVGVKKTVPEETGADIRADLSFTVDEDGSWTWFPGSEGERALREKFSWLSGRLDQLTVLATVDDQFGPVLSLQSGQLAALFVAGDAIRSVQAEATIKLDEFDGTFMIVHHLQDSLNYDFLAISKTAMQLGRFEAGKEKIFQEKPVTPKGWVSIRVVGDGRHFRGYLNRKLVAHGHSGELAPGLVGLRLLGKGTVHLQNLKVLSLPESEG
ncbi:MAG: hypothetical protein GXO92_01535 [FCB group bacterium]|nr:hypothetical protein [FCB group bacterium]